jgi:hypothetical protein
MQFLELDPSLNYGFLFKVYSALSLISLFFFVLQFQFNVDAVTGFWIVPSPTLLCLPFLAWRWRQQSLLAPSAPPAPPLVKPAEKKL